MQRVPVKHFLNFPCPPSPASSGCAISVGEAMQPLLEAGAVGPQSLEPGAEEGACREACGAPDKWRLPKVTNGEEAAF